MALRGSSPFLFPHLIKVESRQGHFYMIGENECNILNEYILSDALASSDLFFPDNQNMLIHYNGLLPEETFLR